MQRQGNHMPPYIIFIALALIFVLLKAVLDHRLSPSEAAGDRHQLDELAFNRGCSVYDLFVAAGIDWKFSRVKIDQDFERFAHEYAVPTYVRMYLRQQGMGNEHTYHKLLFPGGRPPYL